MSRKKPFRVGRSLTGLGLFATEPIKKKTLIVEYKGPRLTNDVSEKLEARGSRYLYEVNSRWTIDGSGRNNLGRYSNHSCRPNSESHQLHGKVFIRALRAIKEGEEITWNYGRDYFVNVITPARLQVREVPREAQQARGANWRWPPSGAPRGRNARHGAKRAAKSSSRSSRRDASYCALSPCGRGQPQMYPTE